MSFARTLTLDVQYQQEVGYVGMCEWNIQSEGGRIFLTKHECIEEYVPGKFFKREGPILLQAIDRYRMFTAESPDLLIIDGHGTAHPQKSGIAVWIGTRTKIPTIGLAKRSLLPNPPDVGTEAGDYQQVLLHGEVVGHIVRTQKGIKPVFVSPGFGISCEEAVKTILSLRGKFRIIEPMRKADFSARAFARGEIEPNWISLLE